MALLVQHRRCGGLVPHKLYTVGFFKKEEIMTTRKLYVTEFDKSRLEELIAVAEEFSGRDRKDLKALAEELEKAVVVSPQDVPADVVTINSKMVLCDLDTSEEMTYVLVFPRDANIDAGAISVLAPVGTAIFGYAKGDIVEWAVPAGVRRLRINDVLYQPEAAGDYHL
jgi:regulator of nucleoside diphosphate kinase